MFAAGLSGLVLAADVKASGEERVSRYDLEPPTRHPGQNGPLTAAQQAMAAAAWKYFQNNFQEATCLYNSVDGYPSTTMWDTASAMAGLVAAFELELVDAPEFDRRMSCLLASLNRMPLYQGELPNKAYHTISLEQVDYDNTPKEIGFSAIDLGRLLTWLAIVKERYPVYAEPVDRFVLRWNFCNLIDRGGTLYGALSTQDGGVVYLQEGRLGYEEYAATGFQLWDFNTEAASRLGPKQKQRMHGVAVTYDGRDPKEFGAHNYVVTEAFLLSGIELNWDKPDDATHSDLWLSDRAMHRLAKNVYKVQYKRWKDTGTLTARTEHHVDGPPYFVYDTIYSDGVEWNTMTDTGQQYPELAAVSTKAAVGLSILFDTPYTEKLMEVVHPLVDPERGIFEGVYEKDGRRVEALTANTNGIVLETLLYKVEGKLYRDNGPLFTTLWDNVPNGEYPGNWKCLPGSAREPDPEEDPGRRGRQQMSRQHTN